MGIGVSIAFSGLCALVTNSGSGTGQVVLVDTRSLGEVGGVALPAHAPTLVLELGSLVNPEMAQPERVIAGWPGGESTSQVGLWDLTGSEVRIRVQGVTARACTSSVPATARRRGPSRPARGTIRQPGETFATSPTWRRSLATGASIQNC